LDEADIDATLMLDAFGYVAEADTANIFLVSEGKVRTPFATSCLHGITRETVLDLAQEAGYDTGEAQLTLAGFYSGDEVSVTGTVCELVPVTEIDARRIGVGEPGPVWWDLLSRYRAQVKEQTR